MLLAAAILVGLAMLAWQGWRTEKRANAWIDAGLLALMGGIVGGRAVHVAIHWPYFSDHVVEAIQVWHGGLDWHGALLTGLAVLALACRWRQVIWRQATDALAFALPAGAVLVYTGCLADRCAAGRAVDSLAGYAPLVVAELPDLYGLVQPRFNSQLFGIVLGAILLAMAWLAARLVHRPGVCLWLMMALLGLGVFGIGYTRGEAAPMVGGLRLDQALDLVVAAVGLSGAGVAALTFHPAAED